MYNLTINRFGAERVAVSHDRYTRSKNTAMFPYRTTSCN